VISELLSTVKDIVLALAGSGLLAKISIDWYVSKKERVVPVTQVNGGNGKGSYATMKDLMEHAVDCPKDIHLKIEQYNKAVVEQINTNHKETMDTFSQIKVQLAELKVRRTK